MAKPQIYIYIFVNIYIYLELYNEDEGEGVSKDSMLIAERYSQKICVTCRRTLLQLFTPWKCVLAPHENLAESGNLIMKLIIKDCARQETWSLLTTKKYWVAKAPVKGTILSRKITEFQSSSPEAQTPGSSEGQPGPSSGKLKPT